MDADPPAQGVNIAGRMTDGILYVFVPNEDCAAKIEANYSDDLAAAAEQVFSQPIRIVNVLPMDFSSHQN